MLSILDQNLYCFMSSCLSTHHTVNPHSYDISQQLQGTYRCCSTSSGSKRSVQGPLQKSALRFTWCFSLRNLFVTWLRLKLPLVAGDDTRGQLGSAVRIAAAVPHWITTFKIHNDTIFDLDFVVDDLKERRSFSDWPTGSIQKGN